MKQAKNSTETHLPIIAHWKKLAIGGNEPVAGVRGDVRGKRHRSVKSGISCLAPFPFLSFHCWKLEVCLKDTPQSGVPPASVILFNDIQLQYLTSFLLLRSSKCFLYSGPLWFCPPLGKYSLQPLPLASSRSYKTTIECWLGLRSHMKAQPGQVHSQALCWLSVVASLSSCLCAFLM